MTSMQAGGFLGVVGRFESKQPAKATGQESQTPDPLNVIAEPSGLKLRYPMDNQWRIL